MYVLVSLSFTTQGYSNNFDCSVKHFSGFPEKYSENSEFFTKNMSKNLLFR